MQEESDHSTGESSLQAKAKWLIKSINNALEHADIRRRENQRRASYIRVGNILLSGTATLMLGLQIIDLQPILSNVAFALVVLVTTLNALEPYFNFRALWVEHEQAIARFHRVKDDLKFYLEGTQPNALSEEKLREMYARYRETWEEMSNSWIAYRKAGTSMVKNSSGFGLDPFSEVGLSNLSKRPHGENSK